MRNKVKQKKAQHESYLRNKEKIKRNRNNRRDMLRKLVDELKNETICMDCGIQYPPYVTDYHHRNPIDKDEIVSRLVSGLRATDRILKEIDKCILLCSNCHRIREHKNNIRYEKYQTIV